MVRTVLGFDFCVTAQILGTLFLGLFSVLLQGIPLDFSRKLSEDLVFWSKG